MESLISENDQLRESQLEGLRNSAMPLDGGNSAAASAIFSPLQSELISDYSERLELLMAENALLLDQKVSLDKELETHQQELTQRTHESSSIAQQLAATSRELQITNAKCKQLEKERDEAAGQAVGFSDALGRAESEIDELQGQLLIAEQKYEDTEAELRNVRSEIKTIKERVDAETSNSISRTKIAENRVRELHILLLQKTKELDAALETIRKLKREYQTTRQDAEGMLQVMSGLERQLNEYSTREADVEKLAKEAKSKMEEAMTIKELALVNESQYKNEVERLIAERKAAGQKRQAEIDLKISHSRQKMNEQLRGYESEIKDLSKRLAELRNETDKYIREGKSAKEAYDRMMRLHEEERKTIELAMKDYEDKLNSLVVSKEEEVGRRVELQDVNKELRITIDKLRQQIEVAQGQLLQVQRNKDSEIAGLKATLKDLQKDLRDKSRTLTRKSKEVDDLKSHIDSVTTLLERKHLEDITILQRRAFEADRLTKEMEETSIIGEKRSQMVIDQIKDRTEAQIVNLQTQLRGSACIQHELQEQVNALQLKLDSVSEERNKHLDIIENCKSKIESLDEQLMASKAAVVALSQQLTDSYNAREFSGSKEMDDIELSRSTHGEM